VERQGNVFHYVSTLIGYILATFSLLDIISGRKEKRGITGNIIINGEFIPENFRCASGYVTQVIIFLIMQVFKHCLLY